MAAWRNFGGKIDLVNVGVDDGKERKDSDGAGGGQRTGFVVCGIGFWVLWFCGFVILVFWICGFGFWSWVLVLPEIEGEEDSVTMCPSGLTRAMSDVEEASTDIGVQLPNKSLPMNGTHEQVPVREKEQLAVLMEEN